MNIFDYVGAIDDKNEKPLDNICDDGGYAAIFRTIGCIGDSLASGEFESTDADGTNVKFNDMYEYSWGQFIGRAIGSRVYNFSKGGMTAKEFNQSFSNEIGAFANDKLCSAYIVALGVNDLLNKNFELGTMSDIDIGNYNNNADTFCGEYGKIISKIKEVQPKAKIFLVSMPKGVSDEHNEKKKMHNERLHEMAEIFDNTYVIDLYTYSPTHTQEFQNKFYLGTHMNPMGYMLLSKMIVSCIDYIIRHNLSDFKQVGFIGTPLFNAKDK